jgi:Pin2-interacting protein X1
MIPMTKKTVDALGARLNEKAGSECSSFARKQMEKMGWTEGQGLGKGGTGITTHLKVDKPVDKEGIGQRKETIAESIQNDEWWQNAFSGNSTGGRNGKKRKHGSDNEDSELNERKLESKGDKKDKKDRKKDKGRNRHDENMIRPTAAPTLDDLFAATGGARLGMRARAKQAGKLKRTEG